MKKNFKIQIKWDLEDPSELTLTGEQLEYLQEEGLNRAFEMYKEGYHSGELHTTLEDETPVWGWWHFSEEN